MSLVTEDAAGNPVAEPGTARETVVPHSTRGERLTSFAVEDFPVPSGHEEDWRFTPLARLGDLLADIPATSSLRRGVDLPDQVTLTEATREDLLVHDLPEPGDRASVVSAARVRTALHLDVPADIVPDVPIRLRLTGTGDGIAREHVVITVGAGAQAVIILDHDGDASCTELVSVIVGDGGRLTLVSIQEWDPSGVHLSEHNLRIGRDAAVKHVVASFGGDLVRISTNVRSAAPGGTFEGLGVYFADEAQHLEHRLFVDHAVPYCTSRVEYKGALRGQRSHAVWIGDVLIRPEAEGTDSYELNRNLVLGEGPRVDSVPNLEIESGEIVGAGHASATGRFDEEQLFYLQARGIPEDEARRLVIRGFFAGIIAQIGVPDVRDRLSGILDADLGVPTAASELDTERDGDRDD
jgi:Fe-S cluster assembly protein SufD